MVQRVALGAVCMERVLAMAVTGLGVPILVVCGEADRVIPAAHAQALAGPRASRVLPGRGHMVHMEAAGAASSPSISPDAERASRKTPQYPAWAGCGGGKTGARWECGDRDPGRRDGAPDG